MTHLVTITTDGSCYPNPGRYAGYAALLQLGARTRHIVGSLVLEEKQATNQVAELYALLAGLQALKQPCKVNVVTDSEMLIGWLHIHPKYGKRCARNDPKIATICALIDHATKPHTMMYTWQKGHVGHKDNELCDKLSELGRFVAYGLEQSMSFSDTDKVWWIPEDDQGNGHYEITSEDVVIAEAEPIGTIGNGAWDEIKLGEALYLHPVPKVYRRMPKMRTA